MASLFAAVLDTFIDFFLEANTKVQRDVQEDRTRALAMSGEQKLGEAPGIRFADIRMGTFHKLFTSTQLPKTGIQDPHYQPLVSVDEPKPRKEKAGQKVSPEMQKEMDECQYRIRDRQVSRRTFKVV
jgi:hypothetical protein